MKKLFIFTISLLISQTATCMNIFQAIQTESLGRVQKLINENPEIVNAQNTINQTPLHIAAYNGHTNVATILLDHGANIDAQDDFNQTPLHYAASNDRTNIATVLLDHGANVNAQDNNNQTPLHYAASNGRTNVVQLLKDWPDYQNAIIRMLREQQERVDILLLAQDSRSVDISPHFPQLCVVNIAKFACPELMKTKYSKLFSDDDLNQLGKLSYKHNPQEIHEIAEQERKQERAREQQEQPLQQQNNSWCSIQ